MFLNYNMFFIIMLIFSTLISISSYSWMGMWMGLEVNLLMFIPLIQKKNNAYSSESSMKYFFIQAIASSIFMFSMIFLLKFNFSLKYIQETMMMILNSSLLLKMGMAPFHFWFTEVIEGMNWMNCFILLTWQKISPMILFMYNLNFQYYMFFIIISSNLIASISSMNQISLRKIMAFSSINHMAWMISSMLYSEMIWLYYLIIYIIFTLNLISFFYLLNIFYLNQLILSLNNNFLLKFNFSLNFMSISGMPPFIGFYPKWLTIHFLINLKWSFLSMLMIIFTLLMIFIYLRLIFNILIILNWEINYLIKIFNKMNFFIIFNSFSLYFLMFFSFVYKFL